MHAKTFRSLLSVICTLLCLSCATQGQTTADGDTVTATNSTTEPKTLMRELAFPRSASLGAIERSIAQNTSLTAENFQACQTNVEVIAREIRNEDDMILGLEQTRSLISSNVELYHTCFLQRLLEIDRTLKNTESTFRAKSQSFMLAMKEMWLLARALDHLAAAARLSDSRYFVLLRNYYLKWSYNKFGRPLNIEGRSLDRWPQHMEKSGPAIINPPAKETPIETAPGEDPESEVKPETAPSSSPPAASGEQEDAPNTAPAEATAEPTTQGAEETTPTPKQGDEEAAPPSPAVPTTTPPVSGPTPPPTE
ncbi:MAG: hypothetical protein OXT67_10810 [Zetaproteobacteria bacterium]|nr:hypothetical protein [Zetaproteobacteria bacterium]